MMETMDQGDVVIRPSSKGENHLTVTWKVADGIYQHVDIREEGKENAFSLGHTLWINNEVNTTRLLLYLVQYNYSLITSFILCQILCEESAKVF